MQGRVAGFDSSARYAFRLYLRTGRHLPATDAVEVKFNPYHDPRNGQFTFAPGGPRSLGGVPVSPHDYTRAPPGGPTGRGGQTGRGGRSSRGSGAGGGRPNYDPTILLQVFPGLGTVSERVIMAADAIFDIFGPANALTTEWTHRQANELIKQILKVDPRYRSDRAGSLPKTMQGQINYLNGLRMDRAAALYRVRGETGALQVETLRFLQTRVDKAYDAGLKALKAGGINLTPSARVGLGNFVDWKVRNDLREFYTTYGVRTGTDLPVRVVGREYRTTETERTYTVPDARVGKVAFDMTLFRKTPGGKQVRGFFASDFQPETVIIIRPSQLGRGSTYAIQRPRS